MPLGADAVASALDWRPLHPRSQEHARLAYHAQRYDCYQQLLALHKAGLTSKDIARRLGMNDRTVRRLSEAWYSCRGPSSPKEKQSV